MAGRETLGPSFCNPFKVGGSKSPWGGVSAGIPPSGRGVIWVILGGSMLDLYSTIITRIEIDKAAEKVGSVPL